VLWPLGITPSRISSRGLASSWCIQGSYRGSLPAAVARMQSMRRNIALAIHPCPGPCAHVRRGTKESSGSLALPHRHQACWCSTSSTRLAQSNTFCSGWASWGATVGPTCPRLCPLFAAFPGAVQGGQPHNGTWNPQFHRIARLRSFRVFLSFSRTGPNSPTMELASLPLSGKIGEG
jgi:hypothetical protein